MWFLNKGPTQTELYKHILEILDLKSRGTTIRRVKTKVLISFAVTAKLICAFGFAFADCWFSHEVAHMFSESLEIYHNMIKKAAQKKLLQTIKNLQLGVYISGNSNSINRLCT